MKNANMGRLGHLLRDWNNQFFSWSSSRNLVGDLPLCKRLTRTNNRFPTTTLGNDDHGNNGFPNPEGCHSLGNDDNNNGARNTPHGQTLRDDGNNHDGFPCASRQPLAGRTGFTLIELLVVVLIIGILASVAVPQYTKAVWKARFSEALVTVNSMEKALQLYVLQNGYTQEYKEISPDEVDIDVFKGLNKNGDYYCSKYVCYRLERYRGAGGSSNVAWRLWMYRDVSHTDPIVEAGGLLPETTYSDMKAGEWYRLCYYEDDPLGQSLCAQTEHLGWQDIQNGF